MGLAQLQNRLAALLLLLGLVSFCKVGAIQQRERQRRGWSEAPVEFNAGAEEPVFRGWSASQVSPAIKPLGPKPNVFIQSSSAPPQMPRQPPWPLQHAKSASQILTAVLVGYLLGRWHGKQKHTSGCQHAQPSSLKSTTTSGSDLPHLKVHTPAVHVCDNPCAGTSSQSQHAVKSTELDGPSIDHLAVGSAGMEPAVVAEQVVLSRQQLAKSGMGHPMPGLAETAKTSTTYRPSDHAVANTAPLHAALTASPCTSSAASRTHSSEAGPALVATAGVSNQQLLSSMSGHDQGDSRQATSARGCSELPVPPAPNLDASESATSRQLSSDSSAAEEDSQKLQRLHALEMRASSSGLQYQQHLGRGEAGSISTLVMHEEGHVSLRDNETWNWMLSVLHERIGLTAEELQSPDAKWKLASLLPQYGSLLESFVSSAQRNRRALEAADIQRDQTSIAKDSHSLKIQQSHERRLQLQTNRMLALCGDCLISGLIIMAASLTWTAWQQGLGRQLAASCLSTSWDPPAGLLGSMLAPIHPAISLVGHVLCYVQVLGRWLLGLMACALIGWIIQRSKGLHNYHKAPMLSMVLGLMLACGLAGWYSTAALGGHQAVWLSCWEAWTFLHLLAACNPTFLSKALSSSQSVSHQPSQQSSAAMPQPSAETRGAIHHGVHPQQQMHIAASPGQQAHTASKGLSAKHLWLVWQHCRKPLFCIFMGLVMPAVTGWLPFQFSSAQPATPAVAFRQTAPHGGLEWVDVPLEPNW